MKKITIIYLALIFAIPVLLQAQFLGGNGRGDVSVSLSNIHISVREITVELPAKYELSQNYPNPFNPNTVIKFSLSVAGNVSLKVYDILGKEVTTLVNEKLQPGTYETSFNGSELTSGVYFYKLTAGDYSETKRMILIK